VKGESDYKTHQREEKRHHSEYTQKTKRTIPTKTQGGGGPKEVIAIWGQTLGLKDGLKNFAKRQNGEGKGVGGAHQPCQALRKKPKEQGGNPKKKSPKKR